MLRAVLKRAHRRSRMTGLPGGQPRRKPLQTAWLSQSPLGLARGLNTLTRKVLCASTAQWPDCGDQASERTRSKEQVRLGVRQKVRQKIGRNRSQASKRRIGVGR